MSTARNSLLIVIVARHLLHWNTFPCRSNEIINFPGENVCSIWFPVWKQSTNASIEILFLGGWKWRLFLSVQKWPLSNVPSNVWTLNIELCPMRVLCTSQPVNTKQHSLATNTWKLYTQQFSSHCCHWIIWWKLFSVIKLYTKIDETVSIFVSFSTHRSYSIQQAHFKMHNWITLFINYKFIWMKIWLLAKLLELKVTTRQSGNDDDNWQAQKPKSMHFALNSPYQR